MELSHYKQYNRESKEQGIFSLLNLTCTCAIYSFVCTVKMVEGRLHKKAMEEPVQHEAGCGREHQDVYMAEGSCWNSPIITH